MATDDHQPNRISRMLGTVARPMIDAVDIDLVMDRIDVNEVIDRVDMNSVLGRLDMNQVLANVDMNQLLERVDVDALIKRVDVQSIIDRVDVQGIIDRVDVDGIIKRVDVNSIVASVKVGNVVTDTASTFVTGTLDLIRSQLAAIDALLSVIVRRIFRKNDRSYGTGKIAQRPAGAASRLAAYVLDITFASAIFGLLVSLTTYLVNLFLQKNFDPSNTKGIWWIIASAMWYGVYFWIPVAMVGRTPGKALLGLRIVKRDGTQLGVGHAFIRMLTVPISFLLLGLGFIGIVVGRERRALEDVTAGSHVVYDWRDREARIPKGVAEWLSTRATA
jgi:uncharacterized RDD family membrane protein YckC